MTPDDFVKYASGTLLLLMFGFLFIIAIGMALEAVWHLFKANLIVQLVVLHWRTLRRRDCGDKEHAQKES